MAELAGGTRCAHAAHPSDRAPRSRKSERRRGYRGQRGSVLALVARGCETTGNCAQGERRRDGLKVVGQSQDYPTGCGCSPKHNPVADQLTDARNPLSTRGARGSNLRTCWCGLGGEDSEVRGVSIRLVARAQEVLHAPPPSNPRLQGARASRGPASSRPRTAHPSASCCPWAPA